MIVAMTVRKCLFAALVGAAWLHAAAALGQAPAAPAPPAETGAARGTPYTWFDPLIDLRALIVGGFVDTPDAEAMQRAALEAMTRALRDPYTVYVPPDSEGLIRRQISGSYVGIGVELDIVNDHPVVVTAMDDSPALAAGILPGDVILQVDGRSTEGVDVIGLEQLLPGAPGTTVTLLVQRPDGAERTVQVERAQIESRSVKGLAREGEAWRFMLDPEQHLGYVRITQFDERTAEQLDSAIARMRSHGLAGLVLDLRGNGGGSLDGAVAVADRFLRKGGIVSLKGRGERGRTWDATASDEDVDVPLVVLVNQGSASASEVLAGALQDNGRAKLVGTRSFGKGSVQEVRSLPDGAGMLKMTTARYFLPSGRTVARTPGVPRWGVEPDSGFHVPMSGAQLEANFKARRTWESSGATAPPSQQWENPEWIRAEAHDPQLAAGLEALRGYMAGGLWPAVGDLSGDVGANNDELRDQLDQRRRLLAELERTEAAISQLRGQGAGVDDSVLAPQAELIDGEMVVRDRNGREVARLRIKDPEALTRALRDVGSSGGSESRKGSSDTPRPPEGK